MKENKKATMSTLKRILKVISAAMVTISLCSLVTPTGQTFAASKRPLAGPEQASALRPRAGSTPSPGQVSIVSPIEDGGVGSVEASTQCQAAPKVKAPPSLSTSTSPTTQELQTICPAGLVPQPVEHGCSSSTRFPMPFQRSQPELAVGSIIADGTQYIYASAAQRKKAIGASGDFTQHKPYVDSQDFHSLAELAVLSEDSKQIVEIGWKANEVKNAGPNGDTGPHLFVFHWINGKGTCYNGAGYVQYSKTLYPGMSVAMTEVPQGYGIMNYQGDWWLWYQDQWIGYFPGSLWSSQGAKFDRVGQVHWFGEIAAAPQNEIHTHTQMGNGRFGTQPGSASITRMRFITSVSSSVKVTKATPSVEGKVTDNRCYDGVIKGSTFTYGGPGC